MNIKKSKKADLEHKRVLFFEIGLILTLALVLTAFEWSIPDKYSTSLNFDRNIIVEEDMIGVYEKKKEIVLPKPIIMIPVPTDTQLDIEDEILLFTPEDSPDVYNNLDGNMWEIKEIETEDTVIHVFVQHMPEFPGGESALFAYLAKNVPYKMGAKEAGISGTVLVSFIVWKDGSIRDIEIMREVGGGLEEGVIRAVENMPNWKPGEQNGKKVNVKFRLPVKFKLN